MELKKIDNFWHFLATQNYLFLKKQVNTEIIYKLSKNDISLTHSLNPRFLSQSSLTLMPSNYELGVEHYASSMKKFGMRSPPPNIHQKLFFPKAVLKLNSNYPIYVERDRFKNLKISLLFFLPKNIRHIISPVNLISQSFWGFKFFSEVIKN